MQETYICSQCGLLKTGGHSIVNGQHTCWDCVKLGTSIKNSIMSQVGEQVKTRDVKLSGLVMKESEFRNLLDCKNNYAAVFKKNTPSDLHVAVTLIVHLEEPKKEITPSEISDLVNEWYGMPSHTITGDTIQKFLLRKLFPDWTT